MRLMNTLDSISCLPEVLTNLTLDPGRFVLDDISSTKIVFLTSCSKQLPINVTRYRLESSCDQSNRTTDQLVMLENDTNLGIGKEVCSHVVVAPVEMDKSTEVVVDRGNYVEVVKRGFMMSWLPLASDCGLCERSGGKCGFNMTMFVFQCFCLDGPDAVSCKTGDGERTSKWIILVSVLGVLGVVSIAILIVIKLCLKRDLGWLKVKKYNVNAEMFLKNQEFLAPKRYTYSQVKKMTNSFEVKVEMSLRVTTKVGQGGFGSVYIGKLSNQDQIAVKVLSKVKGNGEDFINEVASVGRTSHVNIVTLVGFCLEGNHRVLIYEFMPNGSLERFIYGRSSSNCSQLGWEKLLEIAVGIARGLEYLHRGCNTRILHFDIKPHNILLDQDFCPKISDFGLAKLFPDKGSTISMSQMRGTPGYIAPELFSRSFGGVSHKSDVYSYGMMILEIVGGRRNIEVEVEHTSEIYFPHWIYKKVESHGEQLGLHGIVNDSENDMARKMIIVGLWCIQTNSMNRPTITRVLEMLEGGLELLEIPPKPYFLSPSSSLHSPTTNYFNPSCSAIENL
ncbi:LEAF RUST 10 DISEASE-RESISTANCEUS RECEPTOR-LIKE PROTEIN KINASE-like 2.8 [Rutidosis leptorrhynchoides]|uniref:LEAF RUST 10 DISEASE-RESISTANCEUS RECEPTOR-LIKE PROTEIN KINASE-like 2.8 n=1 Tax=Rutidosis leptorrhynchoides TaxID=125765 RepID=UPI003A9A0A70